MRFAISLPQFFEDGSFDPATFAAFVRRAEELGYHSGWTHNRFSVLVRTSAPSS